MNLSGKILKTDLAKGRADVSLYCCIDLMTLKFPRRVSRGQPRAVINALNYVIQRELNTGYPSLPLRFIPLGICNLVYRCA